MYKCRCELTFCSWLWQSASLSLLDLFNTKFWQLTYKRTAGERKKEALVLFENKNGAERDNKGEKKRVHTQDSLFDKRGSTFTHLSLHGKLLTCLDSHNWHECWRFPFFPLFFSSLFCQMHGYDVGLPPGPPPPGSDPHLVTLHGPHPTPGSLPPSAQPGSGRCSPTTLSYLQDHDLHNPHSNLSSQIPGTPSELSSSSASEWSYSLFSPSSNKVIISSLCNSCPSYQLLLCPVFVIFPFFQTLVLHHHLLLTQTCSNMVFIHESLQKRQKEHFVVPGLVQSLLLSWTSNSHADTDLESTK